MKLKKLLKVSTCASAVALMPVSASALELVPGGLLDLYGDLDLSFDVLDDGDENGTNVSSNESFIGFKGQKDLGNGLTVMWKIEELVDVDDATSSQENRDKYLGLSDGTWTVKLGNVETPARQLANAVNPNRTTMADNLSIIGNANGTNVGSFNGWGESAIRFTYDLGNVEIDVQHSSADANNGSDNGINEDNSLIDVALSFNGNGFWGGVAFQRNVETDTDLMRFGANIDVGFGTLSLTFEDVDTDEVGAERTAYGVVVDVPTSQQSGVRVGYLDADEADDIDDSGASVYSLTWYRDWQNGFDAYVQYAMLDKDDASGFTLGGPQHGDNLAAAAGEDKAQTLSAGIGFRF